MAPGYTRIYNNDTSGTRSGGFSYDATVTFHPTSNNVVDVSAEAEAERLEEIDRLEAMMHDRAVYDVNKRALQHREMTLARCSMVKHKKPHMNRKVIR